MHRQDFDYHLPLERIAQVPVVPRDSARLLVDRGPGREPEDRRVAELDRLLRPGDLLVVNDSRVRPARLRLRKETGAEIEVLLLEPVDGGRWEALVRPGRRVAPGTRLASGDGELLVEVGEARGEGLRLVEVVRGDPAQGGEVPLPPYIHARLDDAEGYQTVYARRVGSVAAPTAGLHLTAALLARCAERGIGLARLDLAIGLDTFRPVTAARLEDHPMHSEAYAVPAATMTACAGAGRVVAVGTTVVRALESAALTGRLSGRTDLFVRPGFPFQVVDVMLTNFHLPRSTLLAMVEAFVGPRWRDLYRTAVAGDYRFLSFGDAMLIERAAGDGR